jgi:small subunit ribosomal protein S7e
LHLMNCSGTLFKMSAAGKILRSANAPRTPPSDIELQVGTALLELESSVADLKTELRPLQISSAQEIDVKGGRKAVVM